MGLKWRYRPFTRRKCCKCIIKKTSGWSYENEWRIIDKDNQYLNLEKGEITKVIIGYKVSASVRDIIIKKCNAVGIEAEIGFIDTNNCGFVEVEAPLYIKMMKDIKQENIKAEDMKSTKKNIDKNKTHVAYQHYGVLFWYKKTGKREVVTWLM